MEYTKEIYESEYGYGYKIFIDGVLTVIQPYTPSVAGHKGMTSSEANDRADKLIERMSEPPEEIPEGERIPEEMMRSARADGDRIAMGIRTDEPNPN